MESPPEFRHGSPMTGDKLDARLVEWLFTRRKAGYTPDGSLKYPNGSDVPEDEHPDVRCHREPFTDVHMVFHLPGVPPRHLLFSGMPLYQDGKVVGGIYCWKDAPAHD